MNQLWHSAHLTQWLVFGLWERLVLFVPRVSYEPLPVSCGSRSHQQFVVAPHDFGLTDLVSWIDYVRSFSFGELDSHLQQMD